MKPIRILLLLLLLASFSGEAQKKGVGYSLLPLEWVDADKQLHLTGGAFIGFNTFSISRTYGANRLESYAISVGSALLIGTLKEWSDSNKAGNYFDGEDLAYTVGGSIVMSFALDVLSGDRFKERDELKKQKRRERRALKRQKRNER